MKKYISIYLLSLLTSIFICSCSDDFTSPVYDLGSKTFDEPFVGLLKNKPSILEKSLKYPPFSWFTSDTVSFRKDFEVTFNEECLRSKTEVTFYMTDSLNQMYKGADIFYNGKKIENGGFVLMADSLVKNISLEYRIHPQLGDYTSIGNIQITAKELDKVNGLDLSQEAQIVGIWECQQEIGWPIMIWLLWLVILIALIALIIYVLYLLYQAFVFIFTRASFTKQVNTDSHLNNKEKANKTDKEEEKKKDKKEKEKIPDEWIRIPKEELSSELFEFVERMKKRTGEEFFNSLEYYKHRDIPNKFKIMNKLAKYNSRIILNNNNVYCTIGNNISYGSLNEFLNDVPLLTNKIYHIVNQFEEKDGIIKYYTDMLGRVDIVKVNLYECLNGPNALPKNSARGSQKHNCEAKGGGKNDDGGHLIAHEYNGPDEAINIVPMPKSMNRNGGEWRLLETETFASCCNNVNSNCIIMIKYNGLSYKPSHIEVRINGEIKSFKVYS